MVRPNSAGSSEHSDLYFVHGSSTSEHWAVEMSCHSKLLIITRVFFPVQHFSFCFLLQTSGFSLAEFKKFKNLEKAICLHTRHRAHSQCWPSSPGSYTLVFDGGSRGSPGISGAGATLFDERGQEIWRHVCVMMIINYASSKIRR